MRVIISAGSNNVHHFQESDQKFLCSFESYGHLFRALKHEVTYVPRNMLSSNPIQGDILWIEWADQATEYVIRRVRNNFKIIIVAQHGPPKEFKYMFDKCAGCCDAYNLYDEDYKDLPTHVPIIALPHPVLIDNFPDNFSYSPQSYIILGHVLSTFDDTRELILNFLAATKLNKKKIIIISDKVEETKIHMGKYGYENFEIMARMPFDSYIKLVANSSGIISWCPAITYGRDVPICAKYHVPFVGSNYVVSRYLNPESICYTFPEFLDKINQLSSFDNYSNMSSISVQTLSKRLDKELKKII